MKQYTARTIRHYDKISYGYAKGSAAVVVEDRLTRFLALLPGKKVLDVACGPGHDTDYCSRAGFDCTGVDLSKGMLDYARKYAQGTFKEMDILNLSTEELSFDGLWCSSCLVHIRKSDLPQVFKRFHQTLTTNGVIGIITAATQQHKRRSSQDTREYVTYTEIELGTLLQSTGFSIVASEVFEFGKRDRLYLLARK